MSLLKRELKWHCTTDEEFLTLFDSKLSLPQQNSWTLCHLPKEMCSKVILVVVTQHSEKEERQQLTSKKTSTGNSCVPMHNLWEWDLSCQRTNPDTNPNCEHLQDLLAE